METLARAFIPAPPPLDIHLLSFPAQKLILVIYQIEVKWIVWFVTYFAKSHLCLDAIFHVGMEIHHNLQETPHYIHNWGPWLPTSLLVSGPSQLWLELHQFPWPHMSHLVGSGTYSCCQSYTGSTYQIPHWDIHPSLDKYEHKWLVYYEAVSADTRWYSQW